MHLCSALIQTSIRNANIKVTNLLQNYNQIKHLMAFRATIVINSCITVLLLYFMQTETTEFSTMADDISHVQTLVAAGFHNTLCRWPSGPFNPKSHNIAF